MICMLSLKVFSSRWHTQKNIELNTFFFTCGFISISYDFLVLKKVIKGIRAFSVCIQWCIYYDKIYLVMGKKCMYRIQILWVMKDVWIPRFFQIRCIFLKRVDKMFFICQNSKVYLIPRYSVIHYYPPNLRLFHVQYIFQIFNYKFLFFSYMFNFSWNLNIAKHVGFT